MPYANRDRRLSYMREWRQLHRVTRQDLRAQAQRLREQAEAVRSPTDSVLLMRAITAFLARMMARP